MESPPKARPGTAGLLMIMATSGALLAFGRHDGDPTKAFRNAGRMLLESRGVASDVLPIVFTTAGALHHVIVTLLWGMLLLLAVRALRGWAFVGAALGICLLFTLLNLWLIPPTLGVGYSVVTSWGRAVPLALAMALALLVTPWASGAAPPQPDQYR